MQQFRNHEALSEGNHNYPERKRVEENEYHRKTKETVHVETVSRKQTNSEML